MKSKLLTLIFLPLIVLSQELREYKLLKKFIETKNPEIGFFLLEEYPRAVFEDDLRVLLAERIYKSKPQRAKELLKGVDFQNLSESMTEVLHRLWKKLGLDPRVIALNFPEEISYEELSSFDFSGKEKGKILKRLMRKREYEKVVKLAGSKFCFIKGKALFRLKDYGGAYKALKRCRETKAKTLALKSLVRLGRFKEAERFVRTHEDLKIELAKALFFDGNLPKAKRLFLVSEDSSDKFFYLGLLNFVESKFQRATKEFERALELSDKRDKPKINFWLYKSLVELGKGDEGFKYLKRAAKGYGFYSVVAKILLSQKAWEEVKLKLKPSERVRLAYRLKSIKELGFFEYMRKEAFALQKKLTKGDILMLSRIDPYTAIKIAVGRFGYNSSLYKAVAYPLPYRREVEQISEDFGINPALIYAIMRQESLFDHRAVSVSGAMGLMQLMPFTARWQAEKLGLEVQDFFSPRFNILLGVAYLRHLKRFWNGELIKVIASYNAGEGAVSKWRNYEDDYLFIESIPYAQTRTYVKKVLANYYVYSEILR